MSRWLVVMALMSGCGFGLSGPDPQQPRDQMPKCDTGKGAVVIDGLMATVASIVAVTLVANDEAAGALIPTGIAAAYIGGAVHGSRAVDSCRKAIDEWGTEMAARDQVRRGPPGDEDSERLQPQRVKVRPQPAEMADVPSEYDERVEQPAQQQVPPPQAYVPQQPPQQQAPPQQVPPQQVPPPQQAPKQKQQPKAKQPPPPTGDEWNDFWREVQ